MDHLAAKKHRRKLKRLKARKAFRSQQQEYFREKRDKEKENKGRLVSTVPNKAFRRPV